MQHPVVLTLQLLVMQVMVKAIPIMGTEKCKLSNSRVVLFISSNSGLSM
jgi:hypothetical protein